MKVLEVLGPDLGGSQEPRRVNSERGFHLHLRGCGAVGLGTGLEPWALGLGLRAMHPGPGFKCTGTIED